MAMTVKQMEEYRVWVGMLTTRHLMSEIDLQDKIRLDDRRPVDEQNDAHQKNKILQAEVALRSSRHSQF